MRVIYTPDGLADLEELPTAIKLRVAAIVERLESWPEVSVYEE